MVESIKYISAKELIDWNIRFNLNLTNYSAKKGELILSEGQKCSYFYYILKGFVRMYYYDLNGNEMTHWFAAEDMMTTSPISYFKNESNIMYIEALDDTELILITLEQLDRIIANVQPTEEKLRNLYVDFILTFSKRIRSIHTETAEERYLKLMEEHPDIFRKAKLHHISSFLGITPQSLSRIRKQLSS